MKPTIYVYGLCDVFYDAYYIKGLTDYFGNIKIIFNVDKFPDFNQEVFAAIILDHGKETKFIIDSRDQNDILDQELQWCDVYGKVNYNVEALPKVNTHKILPIGPSFGIKIWNIPQTIFYAVMNFVKFYPKITKKRKFLANYKAQTTRFKLEDYTNDFEVKPKYIYFTGSTWKFDYETNANRAKFVEVCKSLPEIEFEGGLAPRNDNFDTGFKHLEIKKRVPLEVYMQKIKQTTLTFNTPAVLKCHGWKLGEFLALGEVILSTPHVNVLPAPLIDHVHILYVHDENDMKNTILKIINDEHLRKKIQANAKAYFDEYLAPHQVIKRMYALNNK
ncbi:hypothetical protein B0A58_04730 [Flavobacterium branchiophilum NBRC 15030 = ATCC 35035]|uniref:Glycosyltransferase family 1 protein n=1 Tax=Flavobacterium branchiophilum TaxID=55197 RepID=A0A543G5F3_9FLAO|nr:hypothetical protein [Flavobacterium branchiophilum]OXA78050.1 hypothetical protein B0A58_04730 [Flavobacterium branchiophilum NBRC 15030 = ATCC 35035]TQM41275.1 hypothetical protein BC670_2220 [Flavobacterium branchiophilum]GEM54851.1 hypothetical protein FB1_10720 [Flavobacterium branchiophilum NBRC 15030 = ATCC 35035]